jgi:hypothetical protein
MFAPLRTLPPLLAALFTLPPAHAAGGHHAVDDAALLEPGTCEAESWYERSSAPGRLVHLGLGCRVGAFELGAATEPQRQDGASSSVHALQVKWATDLSTGWAVGWSVSPTWQSHARPRRQGTTLAGLLSWSPSEHVDLHVNLGRDFVYQGRDLPRGGLGASWAPTGGAWRLVAEAYRQDEGRFLRAGLRWTPAPDWTLDASRAVRRRGTGDSSWTVGLTREFGR